MKSNKIFATLALSGVMTALVLAGCGGGGSSVDATPPAVTPPVPVTEMPAFVITNTDAVTASVKVSNTAGELNAVQVLVSTLRAFEATSDDATDATSARIKDVILYNSSDDGTQSIGAGGNATFNLKNVNFAAASTDAGSSATAAICANNSDKVLGEVRLEVFGDGWLLKEENVPVCAIQGKTYDVSVSN